MTQISGKIYQMTNGKTGAQLENRFPITVIEAVLGLNSYLQNQFSALADIYMPIEGITETKPLQEFVYRKSAATIKAKSLTLDRIYGKTLAWNQLLSGTISVPSGLTATNNNDGTFTLNGTVSSTAAETSTAVTFGATMDGSHKYFVGAHLEATSSYRFSCNYFSGYLGTSGVGVVTGPTYFGLYVKPGTQFNNQKFPFPIMVDLTLMFGAGNEPSTVEEFESMFPGYHDYEPGKLISNDASALETVGFNVLNLSRTNEFGSRNVDPGDAPYLDENTIVKGFSIDGYVRPTQITSYQVTTDSISVTTGSAGSSSAYGLGFPVRVIPGEKYYINYTKTSQSGGVGVSFINDGGSAVSYYILQGPSEQTVPAGCHWMVVQFKPGEASTTATFTNICINLSDPAKNGTYEPYRKSTMQLWLNSIKVKSHNIWDEEWENGLIDNSNSIQHVGTSIYTKNYIPVKENTEYSLTSSVSNTNGIRFYDSSKNLIGSPLWKQSGGTFTTPSGCAYIRADFAVSTYGYNICINLSSSFNGQYEPHGDITITGGLKSAGSVRDEIVGNKLVKRIGRVDLGTLEYNVPDYSYEHWRISTGGLSGKYKPNSSNSTVANITCAKYISDTADGVYLHRNNKSLSNAASSPWDIYFYDTDLSGKTAEQIKSAMSGVMLNYELATPIEYTLVSPLVPTVTAGTTEARISPNSDGLSAPMVADMTYDANANNDSASAQYALTAGRLLNSHTLWGQTFDGTQDVVGALSGVTSINMSDQLVSTLSTGTAPLVIASTTEVANLHAYTATKLHTQRTLWGQNFDGSGNVTGDMSNVGNIAFSASGKNIASLLYFDTTNSRVGVGNNAPGKTLDVSGTFRATGAATLGSTLSVSGNTDLAGTLTVGTASANKATTLYGALSVSGATTLSGLLTAVSGMKLTTTKKIWFGDTYYIELKQSGSSYYLETNAPIVSTSYITAGATNS